MKRVLQTTLLTLLVLIFATSSYALIAGHKVGKNLVDPATNKTVNTLGTLNSTKGVEIEPNDMVSEEAGGMGDLLIFPFYLGFDGGFDTTFTVVNNDEFQSTVAKLVVRAFDESQEVLDFYIYLSPADTWTGTIRYDAALDKVVMYSEDDSIQTPNGQWTSPNQPFKVALSEPDSGYTNMGYVNVFNVATAGSAKCDKGLDIDNKSQSVDKQDIHDWFWSSCVNQTRLDNRSFPNRNIISGEMTVFFRDASMSASLKAYALRDFNVTVKNSKGQDLKIWKASSYNNIFEVEAALAKNDIAMPYVSGQGTETLHFFTFPTKYENDGPISPVFNANADANDDLQFVPYVYNGTEFFLQRTISPNPYTFGSEVNYRDTWYYTQEFAPDFSSQGWINYEFFQGDEVDNKLETLGLTSQGVTRTQNGTTLHYGEVLSVFGAPVIPVQMYMGENGMTLNYSSWADPYGIVTKVNSGSVNGTAFNSTLNNSTKSSFNKDTGLIEMYNSTDPRDLDIKTTGTCQ